MCKYLSFACPLQWCSHCLLYKIMLECFSTYLTSVFVLFIYFHLMARIWEKRERCLSLPKCSQQKKSEAWNSFWVFHGCHGLKYLSHHLCLPGCTFAESQIRSGAVVFTHTLNTEWKSPLQHLNHGIKCHTLLPICNVKSFGFFTLSYRLVFFFLH